MVNSLVHRATSDLLIGPDWAMNMEISVLLNSDPTQAKDVVKGLKRRLRSKNPKVLLLTLTLLETIVKNCGDAVHIHVVEKNVLNEMFKLVKKKTDFHVKEKILILIDNWQEAFGGPRAKYPQFYSVYQDLMRAGAVFPKRPEKPASDTTQANTATNISTNVLNLDSQQDTAQSEADFPTLSLTEIQNARSIMDVLTQMLNATDPQKKEGFRDEVIVDLVEKCQTYKQRVVHLLHTTSDETLLCEGITLTDELQNLLGKYQFLVSGTPLPKEQLKQESNGALVSVDDPLIDTGEDTVQPAARAPGSGDALSDLFAVNAPSTMNGWTTASINENSNVDLLSGDGFNSSKVENSLALVPSEEPRLSSPTSQQNAIVLADFYTQTSHMETASDVQHAYNAEQAQPLTPGLGSFQSEQPIFSSYENAIVSGSTQNEQSAHTNGSFATSDWNGPIVAQQPTQSSYGAQSEETFPAPPWESQPVQNHAPEAQYPQLQFNQVAVMQQPYQAGIGQMVPGMYMQPITSSNQSRPNYQHMLALNPIQPGGQFMGMFPQTVPAGHQMTASMYPQQHYYNNYQTSGYGQFQQDTQMLNQQMSGLSVTHNNGGFRTSNSPQVPTTASSYLPPMKPKPKPEDSLFGDLVDLKKFKPVGKPTLI
ncbi:unnamed protein product [Rhodiola kirilowii]